MVLQLFQLCIKKLVFQLNQNISTSESYKKKGKELYSNGFEKEHFSLQSPLCGDYEAIMLAVRYSAVESVIVSLSSGF